MLHRTRDLLMRQRTQVINALRAHLGELGITAAQGQAGLRELLAIIAGSADERLPAEAHASLIVLAAELQAMRTLIASIEKRIIAHHRLDEASKRLRSIPGIGLVRATAIAATITDPKAFRSGRDLAAWSAGSGHRHAPQQTARHSKSWSARRRKDSEIVSPMALAVLRLMTSLNFIGCWTARSDGLAPFKILST